MTASTPITPTASSPTESPTPRFMTNGSEEQAALADRIAALRARHETEQAEDQAAQNLLIAELRDAGPHTVELLAEIAAWLEELAPTVEEPLDLIYADDFEGVSELVNVAEANAARLSSMAEMLRHLLAAHERRSEP